MNVRPIKELPAGFPLPSRLFLFHHGNALFLRVFTQSLFTDLGQVLLNTVPWALTQINGNTHTKKPFGFSISDFRFSHKQEELHLSILLLKCF